LLRSLFTWLLVALLLIPVGAFALHAEAVTGEEGLQNEKNEGEAAETEQDPISIVVNGQTIDFDVEPYIEEGRTMVPVRFVSEQLGAHVAWDGDEQKVTINLEDTTIVLEIGKETVWINDQEHEGILDVPAEIVEDRTMVPLRFVSEALGEAVKWEGETRTVFVGPVELTLYFADEQAQYLVPETREVLGVNLNNPEIMSEIIFEELLKGPEQEGLNPTIFDSGNKNINVILTGELPRTGILILNLTGDFVNAQQRGAAGETMAVYSLVHSLSEQPEVENVQFLQDGREEEALFGHIATDRPLSPDPDLVNP